jgi:hypothetical protein
MAMYQMSYQHRAGYGRHDHLAQEVIARAMRRLGYDTEHLIAQHVGLAAHPCPLQAIKVRLIAKDAKEAARIATQMRQAISAARCELPIRPDTRIDVTRTPL